MDRFEKLTVSYLFITIVLGLLSITSERFLLEYIVNYLGIGFLNPILVPLVSPLVGFLTGSQFLLITSHLVYLKIFLDEVASREDSMLWLPLAGILPQLGAVAYLIHRRDVRGRDRPA